MSADRTTSRPVFQRNCKIGRLKMSLTVYRHRGVLPDRWVVHPRFVYDTAGRSRNVRGDPVSIERAIDLDAIRARLDKKVWTPGVATEQACREDIADLLVLLDEALGERDEARRALPSLMSFAIAAPSNPASEQARDAAVERARKILGFPTPSPTEEEKT